VAHNITKVTTLKLTLDDGVTTQLNIHWAKQLDAPVVIILQALGVRVSFYKSLAEALNRYNIHCLLADLRGNGTSSIRPSPTTDFGYYELLTLDIPAIFNAANRIFETHPKYLFGHSLGGQLAALYLSKYPQQARGLIMMTVASPWYKNWTGWRRPAFYAAIHLFSKVSRTLGYFPGHVLQFAGKEAKTLMQDWSHFALTNKIEPRNCPTNYDESLAQLQLPVLSITFEKDSLVPKRAATSFHKKLSSASIVHRHLRRTNPGHPTLGHFNWIKESVYFAQLISQWIYTDGSTSR